MAQNDDADLDAPKGPSADIPDLRKKEKERKGAGVAWSSGAARSAASVASSAPSGAGFLAKIAALSLVGKVAVAGTAVVVLGGAGLLLGGGAPTPQTASPFMGSSNVGEMSSSIKIHSAGNDRIGVASKGEIAFDSGVKAKPEEKKEEAQDKPAEEAASPAQAETPQEPTAAKDKLDHNLSGAKLSGSAGGQFGGKSIFGAAGSQAAPKFGANVPKFTGSGGKLSSMRTRDVKATAGGRSTSKGRTRGALGQLRLAQNLSSRSAQASGVDAAHNLADNAFTQNSGQGGNLTTPAGPTGLGATPAALGVGGGGGGSVTRPTTYPLEAIKSTVNQIRNLVSQANDLNDSGDMLLAIGGIIFTIGVYAAKTGFGILFGAWAWIIAGLLLMYSGQQNKDEAKKMEDKANKMASELNTRVGDIGSRILRECIQKAIADHSSLDACDNAEANERLRLAEEQRLHDQQRLREISGEGPPNP